jgi:hypothetical protein
MAEEEKVIRAKDWDKVMNPEKLKKKKAKANLKPTVVDVESNKSDGAMPYEE